MSETEEEDGENHEDEGGDENSEHDDVEGMNEEDIIWHLAIWRRPKCWYYINILLFLYITCIINFCNIPLFVSTASYILHLCWPMMRNNIEITLKVMLSDCQLINFWVVVMCQFYICFQQCCPLSCRLPQQCLISNKLNSANFFIYVMALMNFHLESLTSYQMALTISAVFFIHREMGRGFCVYANQKNRTP